jgi:hypothetical protein
MLAGMHCANINGCGGGLRYMAFVSGTPKLCALPVYVFDGGADWGGGFPCMPGFGKGRPYLEIMHI